MLQPASQWGVAIEVSYDEGCFQALTSSPLPLTESKQRFSVTGPHTCQDRALEEATIMGVISSFYVTLSSSLLTSGPQSPFCFRRIMNFGGLRDTSSSHLLYPKII